MIYDKLITDNLHTMICKRQKKTNISSPSKPWIWGRQPIYATTPVSSDMLNVRFIRFILVGAINTCFSYCVYAVFLFVNVNFVAASFMALVGGILFSFYTQGRFVFNNTDARLLGRFVIAWLMIYLANIALIGKLITLGLDSYSAGAVALPFSAVFSYLIQRSFVFRSDQM